MPPIWILTCALSMRRSPAAVWIVWAISAVSQNAWIETRGSGAICIWPLSCVGFIELSSLAHSLVDLVLAFVGIDDRCRLALAVLGQHGRYARRVRRARRTSPDEIERVGDLLRERALVGAAEVLVGHVLLRFEAPNARQVVRIAPALRGYIGLETHEGQLHRSHSVVDRAVCGDDGRTHARLGERLSDGRDDLARRRVRLRHGDHEGPVPGPAILLGEGADISDLPAADGTGTAGDEHVDGAVALGEDDGMGLLVVELDRILDDALVAHAGGQGQRR